MMLPGGKRRGISSSLSESWQFTERLALKFHHHVHYRLFYMVTNIPIAATVIIAVVAHPK
jgi:hypothetical protein